MSKSIKFNSKSFTNYSDLLNYIKELLTEEEKEGKIFNKNEIRSILRSFKDILVKGQNYEIYNFMIEDKFYEWLIQKLSYAIDADVELFQVLLSCVITITDNSEIMCEALYNTELPNILINETLNILNSKIKLQKSISTDDIVAQLILIIHNIARHDHFQQRFHDNVNLNLWKDMLIAFLGSKDKRMRILTLAVLTWLATDDKKDKFLLSIHSKIIENFIEYINKGMKSKDRWYEGLHVWELLSVLQALSCTESIGHDVFLTTKVVSSLINILKSNSSQSKEIEKTLGILWNLSFTNNNKEKLKVTYQIEDAIKRVLQSKDPEIRKKALGLLWELSDESRKEVSKEEAKYDVFISYCHAQTPMVNKIFEALKKKFKLWIDTEGIKGSGLDDMAAGIEQSKILMMGVSPSYKQSQCCHSEASFAYRLKKPLIPLLMERKYKPDGWLGMMISTETYIDVSNMENIEESVRRIEEQIYHKCAHYQNVSITVLVSAKDNRSEGSNNQCLKDGKTDENDKKLRNWTSQNVSEWLVNNEMCDLQPKLLDFNGKMLESLKNMMSAAYVEYHNHLKEDLKLSFTEILKFDSALSNLHL